MMGGAAVDRRRDYFETFRRDRLEAIKRAAETRLAELGCERDAWMVLEVYPCDPVEWPHVGDSPGVGGMLSKIEAALGPWNGPARHAAEAAAIADVAIRTRNPDLLPGLDKWAEINAAAVAEAQATILDERQRRLIAIGERNEKRGQRAAAAANEIRRKRAAEDDQKLLREFYELAERFEIKQRQNTRDARCNAIKQLARAANVTHERMRDRLRLARQRWGIPESHTE